MKQIIVLGELSSWQQETEFITQMLNFTATSAITMDIGLRPQAADLNRKEIQKLFPAKNLACSIEYAVSKLYSQGIADGLLCLVGNSPQLYPGINNALSILPYGTPKIAVVRGNSTWQQSRDTQRVNLPGQGYNLNPVIKICLGNAVFAISGMALCNVQNFGSNKATIGILGCKADKSVANMDLNYISFKSGDEFLEKFIRNGYLQGLLLEGHHQDWPYVKLALAREIPLVFAVKEPDAVLNKINALNPQGAPIAIVSSGSPLASPVRTETGIRSYMVFNRFGSESFYTSAIKVMVELLD